MNKLSKFLIALSVVIASFYGFYRYKLHQYYQLKPKDEKFLREKVFGKDSENRGYSDEGKRQIEEDLKPLFEKPNTNPKIDPIKLKRIYELKLIQERKNVLSNSQKEYIEGFSKWVKLMQCLSIFADNSVSFNNIYKKNNSSESPRMNEMTQMVYQKYTKRLSVKEHIELKQIEVKREECERFANE